MADNQDNNKIESRWHRLLFDQFSSVIVLCRLIYARGVPHDLEFVEVSKNFGPLTGLEDPAGKRWHEVVPGDWEAARTLFDFYCRVVSSGVPARNEFFHPTRKEWYAISAYPLEGDYFAIVFDIITEQKLARQAQQESEERFRRLFNSMVTEFSLFEAIYDENGEVADMRYLKVNPAFEKMTQSKAENYVGKTLRELTPQQADFYVDLLAEVVTSGESKSFESYVASLDKHLEHTAYCPKPGQVAVISVDATERKKAEAEKNKLEIRLQQTHKMEAIGSLAGGIAHDFNNILSAIIGYSELAQFKIEEGKPLGKELKEIYNAGIRARDLVKQILTFSRQAEIAREPMDLIPIFKETLKFLRASLPVTIQIRQDFPLMPCIVLADATQMHQMLMNLCTNAAHAMKDNGGVLEISLKPVQMDRTGEPDYDHLQPGRYLRIKVSDTGCGMPEHLIHRVFDPFFTTKRRGEGTGMGLSVVHGIVNDMGGAISIYSVPDRGSSFQILLPLLQEDTRLTESPAPELKKGSGTILLVDDEEGIIDSGRGILEHLGYTIVATTRPMEALNLFGAEPGRFDLVLTDLTMPYMTGLELAEKIHAMRPDLPILLCTGLGLDLTPQRLARAGIREIIFKPVSTSELAEVTNRVLKRKD